MKEQKIIFRVSLAVAAITLIVGVIGEWGIDKVLCLYVPFLSGHRTFCIDFCMGIFAGAVFSVAISLISYFTKKQEIMFQYWTQLAGHIQSLNLFGSRYFKAGSTTDSCVKKIIESEEVMSDIFVLESSYTELARLRKEISLFRQNSKLKKQVAKTFELAGAVNIDLTHLIYVHIAPNMNIKTQRKYVNQYNLVNSNVSQFSESVKELQETLGIEVKVPDIESEMKQW